MLFICDKCGCFDNTAMENNYWDSRMKLSQTGVYNEAHCTECHGGTWHGKWPKQIVTIEFLREHADDFYPTRGYESLWYAFVLKNQGLERAKRWLKNRRKNSKV